MADYAQGPSGNQSELVDRNLWAGGILWTASQAFFFVCFLFAFFYLKTLNSNGMWRPAHVAPSRGLGTAILVCVLASAAAYALAIRGMRTRGEAAWRAPAAGALAFALAAVVFQCVEWGTMGFGPASGGFASVFVGWTGFYLLSLLGATYWLETLVAQSVRGGREPGGIPVSAGAEGLTSFLYLLAVVEVVAYVLLYYVR